MRTSYAEAVLYALQRTGSVIGFPEVVEREVKKHIVRLAVEASERIDRDQRFLAAITGDSPLWDLRPDSQSVGETIQARLDALQGLIVRVPFTLEHARAALDRVDAGTPPNGPKNQQFKDSAIWEAVLELGESYDVMFVTRDRGFFEGRMPDEGVAPNLREDCTSVSCSVQVIHEGELGDVVSSLQEGVQELDLDAVAGELWDRLADSIGDMASQEGASVAEHLEARIGSYRTRRAQQLALDFWLDIRIVRSDAEDRGEVRRPGKLTVSGFCTYDLKSDRISDIELSSKSVEWEGSEVIQGTYFNVEFPKALKESLSEPFGGE